MVRLLRALPRKPAILMTRNLGRMAFYVDGKDRRRTFRHLSKAFGKEKSRAEIVDLARRVFLHFGTTAADAVRIPKLIREGLDSLITVEGREHLEKAITPNRGFLTITAHFGNWELMAAWAAQQGYRFKVIGAPSLDDRFDKLITENRGRAGYSQISRGKGMRELIQSIKNGYSIGILIDQDTKVEGVFVKFFGRWAHTAVGPVVLAQKYRMSIVPAFIVMKEDLSYHLEVQPPVELESTGDPVRDLAVNTQKCSDRCENIIRRHPEQWVWMHRRWKKQPRPGDALKIENCLPTSDRSCVTS